MNAATYTYVARLTRQAHEQQQQTACLALTRHLDLDVTRNYKRRGRRSLGAGPTDR